MYKLIFALFIFIVAAVTSFSQSAQPSGDGISLAPARFELEMKPGSETTVVVNLDYRSLTGTAQPTRIAVSLADWNITRDGRVEFFKANTRPDSASSWIIYSPGETTAMPGVVHPIRVTISVPPDATPGDHLAALIVEQRPDTIKYTRSEREMIVRYRMASVFYIKVGQLTKKGSFENLYAEFSDKGVRITPTLKNTGNSVIRPNASVRILDETGNVVADVSDVKSLPVLAGSEVSQVMRVESPLKPGNYIVKYRIDFEDGTNATEGVTDLVIKPAAPQIAAGDRPVKKP